MRVLLPPSETKRAGGSGGPLDLPALSFASLTARRAAVLDALVDLSAAPDNAARVLKLGARQRDQIAVNAAVRQSATLPAVERYTGVLYDALAAPMLAPDARAWVDQHVIIQSAAFGPVFAADPLPAYRLSASTRLPGVGALPAFWAGPAGEALAASDAFTLDLRSEAYRALAPLGAHLESVYVRVVASGPSGAVRALNHFNKSAKGALVKTLAAQQPDIGTLDQFCDWAESAGVRVTAGSAGEINLFAD